MTDKRRRWRTKPLGMVLLMSGLAGALLGGCRSPASMKVDGAYQPDPPGATDFGRFNQVPRPRLGGLPYPGAFTLFSLADPEHLGHHRYNGGIGASEKDRGIIYTCRGGFIDIAHTRKTIDLSKYVAVRVEMALLHDWTALRVKSLEPSIYTLRLNYPPFWKSLPAEEKKRLAHELSIRIGQRMASLMMNWHELMTWFGYRSSALIPERQSAFTWDDTGAHAFGAMIGGRAMRDGGDWDDAVTDELTKGLHELGALRPDQTLAAAEMVNGVWWKGFEPLKRQIEVGWHGRPVVAWLVRDLPFCKDAVPHRYELPKLDDVMGRDFSHLLRVEIQPNVMETGSIRHVIPGKPETIDVDKDVPVILDYIRQWHIKHEGEQSLRPY